MKRKATQLRTTDCRLPTNDCRPLSSNSTLVAFPMLCENANLSNTIGSKTAMSGKIPVGVLGATGAVGQKFIKLLEGHPWFEVTEVAASERTSGKLYGDAVSWKQVTPIPETVRPLEVKPCTPDLKCTLSSRDWMRMSQAGLKKTSPEPDTLSSAIRRIIGWMKMCRSSFRK
jgi:hypothetical protein